MEVEKIIEEPKYGFKIGFDIDEDDPDFFVKQKKERGEKTTLWVQWSGELRTSNWGFYLEVDGNGIAHFSGKASGAAQHNITLTITGTWKGSVIDLKSTYSDNTVLRYKGYYKKEGDRVIFEMERIITKIGSKTTLNFNWKMGKIGKCGGEFYTKTWLCNDDNLLKHIPSWDEPKVLFIDGEEEDTQVGIVKSCQRSIDLRSDFSFSAYVNTDVSDQSQFILSNWGKGIHRYLFALYPVAGSYQFLVVFTKGEPNTKDIKNLNKNIICMRGGNIKPGQWSHVAFSWNRIKKEAILYTDGMACKTLLIKEIDFLPNTNNMLEIGFKEDSRDCFFSGKIRHLTLYDECVIAYVPQDLYKKQFIKKATAKFQRVEEDLPDKKDWHDNFYVPYQVGDKFIITADDYEHWYDAFRLPDNFRCLIQKNMFDVEIINVFESDLEK